MKESQRIRENAIQFYSWLVLLSGFVGIRGHCLPSFNDEASFSICRANAARDNTSNFFVCQRRRGAFPRSNDFGDVKRE